MSFLQQAHRAASRQGSGTVDNVTPHLHDHVYFMGTPGHGYLMADFTDLPAPILQVLNDAHRAEGTVGVGEEDCAWAMVMIVAAELYPDADWDAGYATKVGKSTRLEFAVRTAMRWDPLEFAGFLLDAMRECGDQWANYADCLEAMVQELQGVEA